jgi:hypothetical protein
MSRFGLTIVSPMAEKPPVSRGLGLRDIAHQPNGSKLGLQRGLPESIVP